MLQRMLEKQTGRPAVCILTACLLLAMALAACNNDGDDFTPQIISPSHKYVNTSETDTYVSSDLTREASAAPQEDVASLAAGMNDFACDFYHALPDDGKNRFFSPYSIALCFGMVYAGARGQTEAEMESVLNYGALGQDRLHPAVNTLDQQLAARAADSVDEEGKGFQYNAVNAMWGQAGYSFLQDYLDVLALYYGAGLRLADFTIDPNAVREEINDWVEEQTYDKIQDLIPVDALDEATLFVLVNAIYMKADWLHKFEPNSTREDIFTSPDGAVLVDMMRKRTSYNYAEDVDYQAVELDFQGQTFSLVAILPREGMFDAVEAAFDAELLQSVVTNLEIADVELYMPTFEIRPEAMDLAKILPTMGMPTAFTYPDANFAGMDGNTDFIYLQAAGHKGYIKVDETGVEAAAATYGGGGGGGYGGDGPDFTVNLNRPFIYCIRDKTSGAVLFLGRVMDPTASGGE